MVEVLAPAIAIYENVRGATTGSRDENGDKQEAAVEANQLCLVHLRMLCTSSKPNGTPLCRFFSLSIYIYC